MASYPSDTPLRRPRNLPDALVCIALIVTVLLTAPSDRRIGDALQIALPVIGFGCEIANGRAVEYFGRFVVLELAIHIPKRVLGDAPVNLRPNGGTAGFPSGHTAAATFGAATLLNRCIGNHPAVRAFVVLSAAFVGGSRIESGHHSLWQVVAGALLGLGCAGLPLGRFARALWRLTVWIGRVCRRWRDTPPGSTPG